MRFRNRALGFRYLHSPFTSYAVQLRKWRNSNGFVLDRSCEVERFSFKVSQEDADAVELRYQKGICVTRLLVSLHVSPGDSGCLHKWRLLCLNGPRGREGRSWVTSSSGRLLGLRPSYVGDGLGRGRIRWLQRHRVDVVFRIYGDPFAIVEVWPNGGDVSDSVVLRWWQRGCCVVVQDRLRGVCGCFFCES